MVFSFDCIPCEVVATLICLLLLYKAPWTQRSPSAAKEPGEELLILIQNPCLWPTLAIPGFSAEDELRVLKQARYLNEEKHYVLLANPVCIRGSRTKPGTRHFSNTLRLYYIYLRLNPALQFLLKHTVDILRPWRRSNIDIVKKEISAFGFTGRHLCHLPFPQKQHSHVRSWT